MNYSVDAYNVALVYLFIALILFAGAVVVYLESRR